ncbi:NitT/TauT family transport system substrate-binding protein [Mesorhizobium sp. J18]|nr:NitT/TauT family transport system substrate-binding protein [Mesorhizobium sp. J18]
MNILRSFSSFLLAAGFGVLCAAPTVAQEQQTVNVILDWAWRPHHAPFAVGIQRGFFADEGIDLKVEQGRGSATAATLLGQGQFDIAHINVTNAAQAISKGVPIKSIAVYQTRSAAAFIGVKGRVQLDSVEALRPLRIGSTPGGSDGLSLSVFARANGLTVQDFNVVGMEGSGKTTALLQDQVDVVSGDSYAYDALVRAAGEKPEIMLLADFGVPLMGFGFATNETFAAEHPDIIPGFLRAAHRSYAAAVEDPEGACEILRTTYEVPGTNEACVAYFMNLVDLSQSPDDPQWGVQSAEAWDALVGALQEVGEIGADLSPADFWTNDFQPTEN